MQSKTDPTYRWRGFKFRIPLFTLSVVLFYLTLRHFETSGFGWWAWLFVASVIIGLLFELYLQRSYRCPDCKQLLGAPLVSEDKNGAYYFICHRCGVKWYTKTYVPDSVG